MDINQIRQEIEKLCNERDQINQLKLTTNEACVTDKLVRPMIEQVLGYNASDPSAMLIPQHAIDAKFSSNKGVHKVDYAVCTKTGDKLSPYIFVEIKSLDEKTDNPKNINQLADYVANCENVLLGILTNGQDYRLFVKKRGTGHMNRDAILAFSIDELLRDGEKLDLFLKYAQKENMMQWIEDNGQSLFKEIDEQATRSQLFDIAQNLLNSDSAPDNDFIKYMASKSKISMQGWKDYAKNAYKQKVREALNRAVKKIQTDCLARVEKSRNNNADGACAETKTPDVPQPAPVIPDAKDPAEKTSNIVTTKLELQVLEKLQTIADASDLKTQIKYKDASLYINFFIDERSQEEINASDNFRIPPVIRYTGQNKIEKGKFYFNVNNPDELRDLLPCGFEISPPSNHPASGNKYPSIAVQSFEDIDKLAPIFVRCFKKAIDEFIANNPVA